METAAFVETEGRPMPLLAHPTHASHPVASPRMPRQPRLGFLGAGWIGRHRLKVLVRSGRAEAAAVCDPRPDALDAAAEMAPDARRTGSMAELWAHDLDGIVIATPSALHAQQAVEALGRGMAVFCQKPLARSGGEIRQVIEAARAADRLLGVDYSYRHVSGAQELRRLVRKGALGEIFAIDLTFHNAYGPDKDWFYDPQLSGGGCVIDLGIHLADLAGWVTGEWRFEEVRSTFWRHGQPLETLDTGVEDCPFAEWRQPSGAQVRLACSWNLSAGQDAVIEARFYGTQGAVALRNLEGSFYRIVCEHFVGTQRFPLTDASLPAASMRERAPQCSQSAAHAPEPDDPQAAWDAWGGEALMQWVHKLAEGDGFDEEIEHTAAVAELLDAIYRR